MNLFKRITALLLITPLLGIAGCSKSSSDAAITDRVKSAISKEPALKGTKVSVSTDAKVVHLSGPVKSRTERATLIAVARKVDGVEAVKTDLVITPQQKTGVKPQQKTKVAARGKPEPRAQRPTPQRPPQPPTSGN
jgi:hypothetical protein